VNDDLSKRMDDFERNADIVRQASEVLTGHVRVLIAEGWSETQARDIIVALEMQIAKNR
jgi:hypothetical protein